MPVRIYKSIILDIVEEIKKLKLENVVLNFQNNNLNDIINNDISGIKQILHIHTGELNNIHYTHKEAIEKNAKDLNYLNESILLTKSELNSKIEKEIQGVLGVHGKDNNTLNWKIVIFII